MPIAKDVAAELRQFADKLDLNPDAEIARPCIYLNSTFRVTGKDMFLAIVPAMKPFTKKYTDSVSFPEIVLTHDTENIHVEASVDRNAVCMIIKPQQIIPAVYECVPLLSLAEESELEAGQ